LPAHLASVLPQRPLMPGIFRLRPPDQQILNMLFIDGV
jgi:hypothetical protein